MSETTRSPSEFPQISDDRRFTGLSWFCAYSSFILLGLYLLLGLHIRLGLGHWPTPMTEDYQAPLFKLHFELFRLFLLFSWFGIGPIWVLCLLVRPLRPRPARIIAYQLAVHAVGWLCIFLVCVFAPTTFTAWFVD